MCKYDLENFFSIVNKSENINNNNNNNKKWTQEENGMVMECYYSRKPKIIRYRQRMHTMWRDKDMFNITEQMLMNQQSHIRKKQWLTKLELEEKQRRIEEELHGHVPNHREREAEQWLLGFDQKGGDVFLKDVEWL